MNEFRITSLPGDGIGPEVVEAALAVCAEAARSAGVEVHVEHAAIGGAAIDATGTPLPPETLEACRRADAVLLGAVGGPRWDTARARPEQGLLELRKELGLFANLRPVTPVGATQTWTPFRPELLESVDILFVRELTGGIYFGEKSRDAKSASDTCRYDASEIERVVRVACRLAAQRNGKIASVDKANVLETSRLWREVTQRVVDEEFPSIELEHVLVDAMAMHILARPADFDVVVTENMFGDILTDEASMLAGSLGMLPSASLGTGTRGLYEPIHGSAPDIAGRGIANPYGAILSVAAMFRHSFGRTDAAERIEQAVSSSLEAGALPADLAADVGASTAAVTEAVCERLRSA